MPELPEDAVVAVAQLAGGPDVAANLQAIADLVARASRGGADLVVFPEAVMFDFTASAETIARVARDEGPAFEQAIRDLAHRHGLAVVAGLYGPAEGPLATNTLVAYGADGKELGRYEKLHLYDAFHYRESDKNQTAPLKPDFGELVTFDVAGTRFGLMNCYDIRFPEMARLLIDKGADALLVSSGWVAGPLKELHWQTLLQARAIENTCFVAASCQPPPLSVGHSMIIDPAGLPIACAAGAGDLAIARLSHRRLSAVRDELPCLAHRRYGIVPKA